MGAFVRVGAAARRGFDRVTPEPLTLAVVLFLIALVATLVFGDGATPIGRATLVFESLHQERGLWSLLAFTMQACLMLVLGTALAEAPPVRAAIRALASWPRSGRGLVGLVASVSITLALVNWSLSLVGAATLAKECGRVARERGFELHYPLLCAAAYCGMMVWHGGLSGTAPLKVTTQADLLEVLGPELGARVAPIGIDLTIFGGLNLLVTAGLALIGPIVFVAMTPREGTDPDARAAPPALERAAAPADENGVVARFERSPVLAYALALVLGSALALHLFRRGPSNLDLDAVNLALWVAALVLHGRLDRFLVACERGASGCAAIIVQFPLYAGIMAMLGASGVVADLTTLASSVSADLLALLTFLSGGLLNLFVPSGGGQWAIQGPIVVRAALDLGVHPAHVVMALAYGDQWTNMLQPFWALPLLAITGVRAREIVGYTSVFMVCGGLWISVILLLHGSSWFG
jgi:short-chain fatty acids transporter